MSRNIKPVVKIDANGDFKVHQEYKIRSQDYGFNLPIDKFFKDKRINKLIYDSRQEVHRQK